MTKSLLTAILLLISSFTLAQNLQSYEAPKNNNNINVIPLGSDKHASEFLIFIRESVPLHYHAEHTELVYILSGMGSMQLGDQTMSVKSGDFIRIPQGTHHSVTVTSKEPLKVLSVQTPEFTGKDRVMVNLPE
ncbi:cupin domain-containing protein [Thalassotalea euphylliae]|uniref:cupin domain-containing protein n=1 Tax=Thalassotalea euphylliae TaxID=1655234 RepID=UPI003640BEEA